MQCGRVEFDGTESQLAVQRPDFAQRHRQTLPFQQRRARSVVQRQVVDADTATQGGAGLGMDRHREVQHQIGHDAAAAQPHRQRFGQVADVGQQVELAHLQLQRRLPGLRERCGLRAGVERGAVEAKSEPRLDLHIDLRRQVGEEGKPQVQCFEPVLLMHRAVIDVHRRIADLQVVEGEAQRLRGRRLGRGGLKASDQVVDVVVARCGARNAQLGGIDLERLDHRRKTQQRADVGIDIQPRHLEQRQRLRIAGRAADHDVAQRQFE